MKKRYVYSFFLFILISVGISSTTRCVSYNSLYHAAESSWLFLEDLIIKQPKKKVDTLIGMGGLLAAGSVGTAVVSYKTTRYLTGTENSLSKLGLGCASILIGVMQHYALRKHVLEQAERDQIITIMKNWSHLRDKVPYEVWSSLDALHNAWLNDKHTFSNSVNSTISYLKSEVHGRFPNTYRDTTSSFFSRRNLHVQVTFDLYRALKDSFHALKELLA